jgi:hypothetical protein
VDISSLWAVAGISYMRVAHTGGRVVDMPRVLDGRAGCVIGQSCWVGVGDTSK